MFELRYDDYVDWYGAARRSYLEPAMLTACRLVNELLDTKVDPIDRARFRISTSRVKTAQRSFAKLSNDKYRGKVAAYAQVPDIIDDLVGLRLVCNNLSDINTLQEILGELPVENESVTGMAVEPASHRDYFSNPKASGYRAYHVNLVVAVPQMQGSLRVRVEVQARTLLQDGWGELTHEDTYKPGSTVPDWIVGMSLRMAELLAAVDNIAQDLRTGLDVESQRAVLAVNNGAEREVAFVSNGASDVVVPVPTLEDVGHAKRAERANGATLLEERNDDFQIQEALLNETRRLVSGLSKPTALASLAQHLNVIFGTEITKTWARFGGFKRFLEFAAPDAVLSGPAPGYIHPLHAPVPDGWTTEDTGTGQIPDIIRELRTYDKAIPLVGAERLNDVIVAVGSVLRAAEPGELFGNATASQIEGLARAARSDAESRKRLVVRPHAVYVLQAVNRAGRIASDVTDEEVRGIIFDRVIAASDANSLIDDRAAIGHELCRWLGISVED